MGKINFAPWQYSNLQFSGTATATIKRIGQTTDATVTISAKMANTSNKGDGSTWRCYYRIGASGSFSSFVLAGSASVRRGNVSFTRAISDEAQTLTVYIYLASSYISSGIKSATGTTKITHTALKTTPAPSGLTIARDGNKFDFTWKIPDCKFEKAQRAQYRLKVNNEWKDWVDLTTDTTATKKSLTVNASSYYPTTKNILAGLQLRVRGKRSNTSSAVYLASAWVVKTYDAQVPNVPTLEQTLSTSVTNQCTFEWKTSVDTKSQKWFFNTEWQTVLIMNCTETDGSKVSWKSSTLGWQTGTGTANGTKVITENTFDLAQHSYTRWFRVRSRGVQGDSAWRYIKHVYAFPYQANLKRTDVKATNANGYQVKAAWVAPANAAHPIDSTTIQYKITVPDANLACPSGDIGWTDADTIIDTVNADASSFVIDARLADDECLYVRVNNIHDSNVTYGKATLALVGKCADPEDVTAVAGTGYSVTVTATNNSNVPDSFLAVMYRRSKQPKKDYCVGIIPHGSTSVTVTVPNWTSDPTISFGVYACVGSYTKQSRKDGTDAYAVTEKMTSAHTVWDGASVPTPPENVTVSQTATQGTVRLTWDWTWDEATMAELSWADHSDAWKSTDTPSTFTVENGDATAWNVAGLDVGKTWYFRIRLKTDELESAWSYMVSIDLSSAPIKPSLTLSAFTMRLTDKLTAYWTYITTDNTLQSYAKICEATISNGIITYGRVIAHTETAQKVRMDRSKAWQTGRTYLLCVKVTSASGHESEWSDPVAVTVVEPITCNITSTSLTDVTITELDKTVLSLAEMPLMITATGAGAGGTTTAIIERADAYHADRPDESIFNGYEGETIANITKSGEAQITISNDDLIGSLDDGAPYRLIVTAEDSYGQTDTQTVDFEVHWSHQAIVPDASEIVEDAVAKITPVAPDGWITGDVADIYRLSADRPALIYSGAEFGVTYVDPYPAMGESGGHRIVYRTANGDYITEDDSFAWVDLEDNFDADYSIIDFDGKQIILRYNLTLSNQWQKDFKETHYLGGSVQGDWNPSVGRSLNMGAVSVTLTDDETISLMRSLAVYPGICHVRTPDGSSFAADVQISENRSYQSGGRVAEFTLNITRVDPEGLDGVPLALWEEVE